MNPDYSSDAFIEYLSDINNFNNDGPSVVHNLKGTAARLMSNVAAGEFADVRDINPDDLITRHITASGLAMQDHSKLTYRSRINRAISRFIQHQNNVAGLDTDLKDVIRNTKLGTIGSEVSDNTIQKKDSAAVGPKVAYDSYQAEDENVHLGPIDFDIPILLRPSTGLFVELKNVPMDLTEEEADRIAAILKLYAQKA